ncbi:hypothetical protein [Agromyces bauzanensis]
MKAMLGDTVLAEAARDELISIEGNWYFPPYPDPYPAAIQRVGKDFSNYVAFWKEVRVVD